MEDSGGINEEFGCSHALTEAYELDRSDGWQSARRQPHTNPTAADVRASSQTTESLVPAGSADCHESRRTPGSAFGTQRSRVQIPAARPLQLLAHALRHVGHRYTFDAHARSHGVVYQSGRTDLLDLADRGLLDRSKHGRQLVFTATVDLEQALRSLS